ncbi:vWA domain-containing protein [Treponema primitia]|uniref:vWA domain-containing protein n=1 Tax=Treponema primitia TaxID=88058 RepID=UPI000255564A|nr:VWA domain-containing protein [Treponema primitia]
MSFDNPRVLLALFLLIPAGFLAFLHYRKRRAVLNFLSRDSGDKLVSNLHFRYLVSTAAFTLFLACVIIALAEPRGGTRLVSETRRGVDVVFAIDLSRSMDVRDISPGGPSRLSRAASLVVELVNNPWFTSRNLGAGASGVRFGAAIGKGKGVLALPLTEDTEAIRAFLSSLSGSAITGRGTNLESLIDAAAGAFQDAFPSRRRIILLSDGESLGGSLGDALDRAADADITLITVGLGSGEGGAVPLGNAAMLGEDGHPVISYLQDEVLRNAAERTGGIYVDGNRSNAAAQLANYLASLAAPGSLGSGTTVKGFRRETRDLGYIFVIAALIFLGISKIMEKGRRKHG